MHTNFETIQARSVWTLLCTFASTILIPAALHHTSSFTSLLLVLTVSTVWIAFLVRMWMDIIRSAGRPFDARAEWIRAGSAKAFAAARARLVVEETRLPSMAESAELLAAYSMGAQGIIPGTAPGSGNRLAGA